MTRPAPDWRVQAVAIVDQDIPAAYPGGPAHPKGSALVLSSVTKLANGKDLHYLTPSAVGLALSIAINATKTAMDRRPTDSVGIPGPSGTGDLLKDTVALYDYFEACFIVATFSFQAIEAYANYKIAYCMKGRYPYLRDGKTEELEIDEVERRLSTEQKLDLVLPHILGCSSPKGTREWQDFKTLKSVRDDSVHLKSIHQWATSEKYSGSPYSSFIRDSPHRLPAFALNIIRFFSGDPERPWLEGAMKLMKTLGVPA